MKLHLGCGQDIRDDYVNADWLDAPGVDVIWNALEFPWPWPDESAEEILAIDLLEHLPMHTRDGRPSVIAFVEEAWRILLPAGTLILQVPEWDSENFRIDPTHVRGFHPRSMEYFDPETELGTTYGHYSACKFKVDVEVAENRNITFRMDKVAA